MKNRIDRNKVIELYQSGMNGLELSKIVGCSEETANRIIRESHIDRRSHGFLTISKIKEKCNDVGFDYVSGYTGSDSRGKMIVKCIKCGYEFPISAISIRHGPCRCPNCYIHDVDVRHNETVIRNHKRSLIHKIVANCRRERKHNELERLKAIEHESYRSIKKCPICGKEFETYKINQKYCGSKQCLNAVKKRTDNHRGLKKRIVWQMLYKRDKGECYICHNKCNPNDYEIRSDGSFITGKSYPTVEHVIPLSKGGKDILSNTRLACFECNTNKGVNIPEFIESNVAISIQA